MGSLSGGECSCHICQRLCSRLKSTSSTRSMVHLAIGINRHASGLISRFLTERLVVVLGIPSNPRLYCPSCFGRDCIMPHSSYGPAKFRHHCGAIPPDLFVDSLRRVEPRNVLPWSSM